MRVERRDDEHTPRRRARAPRASAAASTLKQTLTMRADKRKSVARVANASKRRLPPGDDGMIQPMMKTMRVTEEQRTAEVRLCGTRRQCDWVRR